MDETRPLEDASEAPAGTVAGRAFGRYVLVRRIGAGGCGEVFAAYDPVLDRRIALKILFHGGGAGWAREARMLAKVDHPQVVTVHDAGVENGQGYLATELIDGPSLDQWLVGHRDSVSPRERLELLLPIAAALGEAHARGIVHGDVKPANILIAESGARITDFGVARAIDADGASESDFAGTPAYMAPEQLEGRPPAEASDQYAFCLTLCQALSDQPIVSSSTDRDGSGSETRAPSDGGPIDFVPQRPEIPVAGLDRAISAALRRGLDPDPKQRFASMQALVDALVTVPRRRRRLRRIIGAGAFLAAGMGAAAMASTRPPQVCTGAEAALTEVWNDDREARMRSAITEVGAPDAATESERVAVAIDAYAEAWKAQHTEICEATSVRKEQSEAVMDAQMFCMARARGRLEAAVDIFTDADEGVLRNATPTVESLIPLAECLDRRLLSGKPSTPVPEGQKDAVDALEDLLSRSHVQLAAGRFDDARETAAEVLAGARDIDYDPMVAEGQYQLAASMAQRGDLEEAKPRGREALRIALKQQHIELTLMASAMLAYISSQSGSRDGAQAYENMALGLIDRPEVAPRLRANAIVDLATVVFDSGRFAEARALYQQSLELTIAERGEDDWRVAHAIDNIAMTDMSMGNDREALEGFERAMAIREASLGKSHVNHVLTLLYLGGLRINLGELEAAAENFERALRITKTELGPKHPWAGASTDGLARVALERDELDRAKTLSAEALGLFRDTLGDRHPFVANSLETVGHVEHARGDYAAAEAAFAEMTSIMKIANGTEHPDLGEGYQELAIARLSQGHWREAIEAIEASLEIEDAAGIPAVERVDLLSERGLARLALGNVEKVNDDFAAAAELLEKKDAKARDFLALFAQGRFHHAKDDDGAARRWYERARDVADTPAARAVVDAAVAGLTGGDLEAALEAADATVSVAVASLRASR